MLTLGVIMSVFWSTLVQCCYHAEDSFIFLSNILYQDEIAPMSPYDSCVIFLHSVCKVHVGFFVWALMM